MIVVVTIIFLTDYASGESAKFQVPPITDNTVPQLQDQVPLHDSQAEEEHVTGQDHPWSPQAQVLLSNWYN